MIGVAVAGVRKSLSKGNTGPPPDFPFYFRAINGVTPVMSWPVGNIADQGLRFANRLQESMGKFQVSSFAATADIVDLSLFAFEPNLVDGSAMVADVNPIAHIEPVAIDRHRLVSQKIGYGKTGKVFLRLMRPVVIRT